MNPLTLLTFGLYGEVLPNQNGAPVRIVVPWKYGFKSAKSIVAVQLPGSTAADDVERYGAERIWVLLECESRVDHPRWSQKTERRIGLPFYKRRAGDADVQRIWGSGGFDV